MRSSIWLAASLALLVFAAGCGGTDGEEPGSSTNTAAGGALAGAGGGSAVGSGSGGLSAGGAGAAGFAGRGGGGAGSSIASGGSAAGSGGSASFGGGAGGSSGAGAAGQATGGGGQGGVAGGSGGGTGGAGGGSSVVFPPNCTCLNLGPPVCTPTGHVTFTLAKSASPTADEQSAYEQITCAMTAATGYYNCNTTITKQLSISYSPGVETADGNSNGSIRFGSSRSYMVCATAMHEIGHAVGVGTAPNWPKLSVDGDFKGETAIAQLRAITGKADDVLHSDTQHFWPYGLNYASEAKSTADLIDHCLMVQAIRKDLGL